MDFSSDDETTLSPGNNITGEKRRRVVLTNNGDAKRRRMDSSSKIWFLTWNSYPEDWDSMLHDLGHLTKWCCQEETASSGQKHIQGVLVFSRQVKFSSLFSAIEGAHWEICRNLVSAKAYCSKLKTRTGRTWVHGFRVPLVVRDPLDGKTLYKYQKQIIKIVKGLPHERRIYWYWSNKGNIGKSSLCKHLCLKYAAISLGGKVSDAMYAVAKLVSEGKPPTVVVFDVARCQAGKLEYVALEQLKNGCFFSGKYESCQVLLNAPHVIVFANEAPDVNKLSEDRWDITNLDLEDDLPDGGVRYPIFL